MVGTQVGVNNNLEIIATTTVQGLANVSDATRYGYDIVASASFLDQNYNKTLTVDQETEGFVVVLNDILGASVNLLDLIPAGFQSQDLLTMFLEYGGIVNITVTPFIEVTDTSCGTNGRITGEPKSYQYPQ
ncbi:MAG: hypothetical protein IKN32_02200 [Bacteroidales bacterium]|nr:hypothetical protein [Bacteroidales bacterium]